MATKNQIKVTKLDITKLSSADIIWSTSKLSYILVSEILRNSLRAYYTPDIARKSKINLN